MDIDQIYKRADGSYVVNGNYHVPDTEEFAPQFAACQAWDDAHPGSVSGEPPVIPMSRNQQMDILRATRDAGLRAKYDPQIAQLTRQLRLATTDVEHTAISEKITEWDAWAVAMCDLPAQDDAPWPDGNIPWPELPSVG